MWFASAFVMWIKAGRGVNAEDPVEQHMLLHHGCTPCLPRDRLVSTYDKSVTLIYLICEGTRPLLATRTVDGTVADFKLLLSDKERCKEFKPPEYCKPADNMSRTPLPLRSCLSATGNLNCEAPSFYWYHTGPTVIRGRSQLIKGIY